MAHETTLSSSDSATQSGGGWGCDEREEATAEGNAGESEWFTMSMGYYLVCDETRLYCAAACDTGGRPGGYGRTSRGLPAFIISHQDWELRVLTEDELDPMMGEYRNWERLVWPPDLDGDIEEIHYHLTAEEAGQLVEKDWRAG